MIMTKQKSSLTAAKTAKYFRNDIFFTDFTLSGISNVPCQQFDRTKAIKANLQSPGTVLRKYLESYEKVLRNI